MPASRRATVMLVAAIIVFGSFGAPAAPVAASPGDTAVQLNGSNQYATLGTASQLRSATFTLELWFKRTGAGVGTSTGDAAGSPAPSR